MRVKQEGLAWNNSIGNNSVENNSMGHSMRLRSRGLEEVPLSQPYDIWNADLCNHISHGNNSDYFMRSSGEGRLKNLSRGNIRFRDLN